MIDERTTNDKGRTMTMTDAMNAFDAMDNAYRAWRSSVDKREGWRDRDALNDVYREAAREFDSICEIARVSRHEARERAWERCAG